ncbi:hypothetical protein ACL9RL_18765 [Plantibacter sp. Mn2098]|uniref:baeRF11 domain-containing protein n=1 Tax=Plantibacter sp. Mn2098 TaxID=3395266 RepID=UPI003BD71DD5
MHIDMPTRSDVERLAAGRDPLSITVYLPTSPVPAHDEENRLRARALFDQAIARVRDLADKRVAFAIEDELYALLDDSAYWTDLGRSLAVFITPAGITEYRLANELTEYVSVSDRFAITPLLRAVTFPHAAFVLALSQNGARLVKVSGDSAPQHVDVSALPQNAESAVGVRSIGGRSAYGRFQGDEGRKVRLTQYARAVDHALRPLLNGRPLPLILAATEPLSSIFRGLSGYTGLVAEGIAGNPDEASDTQLAEASRPILDTIYQTELQELAEVFAERRGDGRAATDLSDLARAATFGAIATLAVDMDAIVGGFVDDDGALILEKADAETVAGHDAIEEIARRALATGARVLAVRTADLPEGVQAAGILRYAV